MHDKFTERVRKVMYLAREEAARLQHDYIGTEHLLLGVIREGEGIAATVLNNLGLDLDAIRQAVESMVSSTGGTLTIDSPAGQGVKKLLKFPAGSFRVAMDQRAANVAVHLLEPWAPDSLLQWGYLNFIFETKEYGEDYILERLAREMMKKDRGLAAEFRQKIAEDPRFASSPRARLDFFYTRSPYADSGLNVYPIGRVMSRP